MRKIWLILFASFFLSSALANSLPTQIDDLIHDFDPAINIGIAVVDLKTDKIIYHRNDKRLYTPASTLKLLTALSGLLYLGPDFHYETTISTAMKHIRKGVIKGDVYITFSGDPTLEQQDIDRMTESLKRLGVNTIRGNVYFDRSALGEKPYGPGWMWDELNLCYAAPVDAMTVNHNCFKTQLTPGRHLTSPAQLTDYPNQNLLPIANKVSTAAAGTSCELNLSANDNNQFTLTGCLHKKAKPTTLDIAVKNPGNLSLALFKQAFKDNHIKVKGKLSFKKSPEHLRLLVKHRSDALRDLVIRMLKHSDNLIAETLFKTLGGAFISTPGTWSKGSKAVTSILNDLAQIDLQNASIVDGSGISRYNLITPNQLAQVLVTAYHNFQIEPEFLAGLPIAGTDGTLRKRLLENDLHDQLRAKTGTLQGVSALAGYLESKHHQRYAFVIMSNNFVGHIKPFHQLERDIVKKVAKL